MAKWGTLREGDRMDAEEFLRRWEAMPELKHAELIDGVVFMASPVLMSHGDPHADVVYWLKLYVESTPGCHCGLEVTWKMGGQDVTQPDGFLRILPEFGGQSGETEKGYGKGAPELIVEVTGSSTSRDLGKKLELYESIGVREYVTVLVRPEKVIWRRLIRGRYREMQVASDGLLKSVAFPGLWLDPTVFWGGKRSIRTAVEAGLTSPEHAGFVKKLRGKNSSA